MTPQDLITMFQGAEVDFIDGDVAAYWKIFPMPAGGTQIQIDIVGTNHDLVREQFYEFIRQVIWVHSLAEMLDGEVPEP